MTERIRHANRIKGLLPTQCVFDFEPIRKDRSERIKQRRWDDQPLPPQLSYD